MGAPSCKLYRQQNELVQCRGVNSRLGPAQANRQAAKSRQRSAGLDFSRCVNQTTPTDCPDPEALLGVNLSASMMREAKGFPPLASLFSIERQTRQRLNLLGTVFQRLVKTFLHPLSSYVKTFLPSKRQKKVFPYSEPSLSSSQVNYKNVNSKPEKICSCCPHFLAGFPDQVSISQHLDFSQTLEGTTLQPIRVKNKCSVKSTYSQTAMFSSVLSTLDLTMKLELLPMPRNRQKKDGFLQTTTDLLTLSREF